MSQLWVLQACQFRKAKFICGISWMIWNTYFSSVNRASVTNAGHSPLLLSFNTYVFSYCNTVSVWLGHFSNIIATWLVDITWSFHVQNNGPNCGFVEVFVRFYKNLSKCTNVYINKNRNNLRFQNSEHVTMWNMKIYPSLPERCHFLK